MTSGAWTSWPSREALSREGLTRARRVLARVVRAVALTALVWTAAAERGVHGWTVALAPVALIACGAAAWGFFRTTLEHLLWPSVGLLAVLLGAAFAAEQAGFRGRRSSSGAAAPSPLLSGCPWSRPFLSPPARSPGSLS